MRSAAVLLFGNEVIPFIQAKQPLSPNSSTLFEAPDFTPATGPWRARSRFDHFEIFLARAALGTAPSGGDVLPSRAGRDTVFGPACGLVVDVAAGEATPGLVRPGRGQAGGHDGMGEGG